MGDRWPAPQGGGDALLDQVLAIPCRDALPANQPPQRRPQTLDQLGESAGRLLIIVAWHESFSQQ
jgi:hypothetical protein